MKVHFLLLSLTKKNQKQLTVSKNKEIKFSHKFKNRQKVSQEPKQACSLYKQKERKEEKTGELLFLTGKPVKCVTVHLTRTAITTSFLCAALFLKNRLQLFSLPGFVALPDLLTLLESCTLCLKACTKCDTA